MSAVMSAKPIRVGVVGFGYWGPNIVRNLDEFHAAFATVPGDDLWLDPGSRVRIW